ncbi:MAG: family 43 glycosylhydrolase [Bacteroidaceae bacterium]|nr:family 43 glycosylhydrolase [Bacteroidaceae bacterium]
MKNLLTATLLVSFALTAQAQNPIIRDQFTADPTARVFNGRLYLFPSHDIPAAEDYPRKDWFCMADYHVFSSDNLTDWTDHGVILDQKNVPWGDPAGYSMWAPDCVEKDGKYYFFFPNKPKDVQRGFGVGVAIADRPEGPYTPMAEPIKGVMGIDPVVLQTSKGEAYMFWASGRIMGAKLKDNLLELDSTPIDVSADFPAGFKEGPFAFEHNGHFYLTFPWVEDKTETLAYAMADQPMGPYEFKGKIMEQSPTGCWTNHHSIVEFKGQWYLFYHHNDYSPHFDKLRAARADSLFFNADGTIQPVRPTLRGVGLTAARSLIQLDRYSAVSEGVTLDYLDTLNTFAGWQLTFRAASARAIYNNVDFGEREVTTLTARVRAPKGATLVLTDLKSRAPQWGGRPLPPEFAKAWSRVATLTVPPSAEYMLLTLPLNRSPRGVTDLQLESTDAREVAVDWVSFDLQPAEHAAVLSATQLQPREQGAWETHSYRNMLAELGYSQAQIETKKQELFDALFTGPRRIYFEVGDDQAYISDVKNHDVRTEGMSYGMMIAVQMDRKDIFDRLWRWAKTNMQLKEGKQKGYFSWSVRPDGSMAAPGAAADGELYFITSLLFAHNRWGSRAGIDYLKEAQNLLDCCMGKNGQPRLIDETTGLIAFVPGSPYTDPSYHVPAFYEVWARYAQDGRSDYWLQCAAKAREFLHRTVHPVTGLTPDYCHYDGSLLSEGRVLGNCFRYDSWRVPMNVALDFSWSHADAAWQTTYGERLQNFLYEQGIDTFLDQYNVDGTLPTEIMASGGYKELRHTPGFVATAAALSLVCRHSKAREFVDRFWTSRHEPAPSGYFDGYYEGILRLFSFLHLSGDYRIIEPKHN